MVNKNKIKGSSWERELVELLNNGIKGNFKKVPGSGALGTMLEEPILTGDINGIIIGLPKGLKIEAKSGYGQGQMTIKKEWLDKIKAEAEASYAIPILFGKFTSSSRSGVKKFAILDIDTFIFIMNLISDYSKELDLVYKKLEENK